MEISKDGLVVTDGAAFEAVDEIIVHRTPNPGETRSTSADQGCLGDRHFHGDTPRRRLFDIAPGSIDARQFFLKGESSGCFYRPTFRSRHRHTSASFGNEEKGPQLPTGSTVPDQP